MVGLDQNPVGVGAEVILNLGGMGARTFQSTRYQEDGHGGQERAVLVLLAVDGRVGADVFLFFFYLDIDPAVKYFLRGKYNLLETEICFLWAKHRLRMEAGIYYF